MKKFFLGLMLTVTLSVAAYAQLSDSELHAKNSANDRALLQQHALKDAAVTAELTNAARHAPALQLSFLYATVAKDDPDGCVDQCVATCQGGAGSAACWQKCTNEGYGSATCAPRCGVSTPAGSTACWQKCGLEGYSSATCGPRCGNTTAAGSTACWQKCSLEGYSSEICAPRCGTSTPEGSQACWTHCSNEGYSSEVCAERCGNG